MDSRKILLIAAGLLLAVVLASFGKGMIFGQDSLPAAAKAAVQPVQKTPRVLIATRALPVGTILGPDSFRLQPWPAEMVQNIYFVDSNQAEIASLSGRVVRTPISAGQPLTQGALVKPGDRGFLAAALGPGMRAIAVPVSALSGVAGFIFPGDRVDLVLTQSIDNDGQTFRASETILRNLKVLATDQRTTSVDDKGQQTAQLSSMVTLEVTPRMAEKISVALTFGQLSLALRAITDGGDLDRAIASGKLKLPDGVDANAESQAVAAFARRPDDSRQTYATAADVSTFQRRYASRGRAPAQAIGGTPSAPQAPGTTAHTSSGVRIWRAGAAQAANF